MIELRWLKYEATRVSPFSPDYKQYYPTKKLQYRYQLAITELPGGNWSQWQDVPTIDEEPIYQPLSERCR